MLRLYRYIPLLSPLLFGVPLASAQSGADLSIGFGGAHVSSTGGGLDNASSLNAFGTCTPNSTDTFCQATPALNGFFMGFQGDIMLRKQFGFGADMSFQPSRSGYGPLQYRQSFYDFNGLYEPLNRKRVAIQILGGLGAARTSFSYTQTACVGTAVCSTSAEPVGNANHFQIHAGVGVQLFLTSHVFVRPQFDYHYVPNLTQQFGSDSVPVGMISLGYEFGERP
jgi:hypothetical protein